MYFFGTLAFCVFNIAAAEAKNLHTILILRFFGGLVGSAPISVGGASLVEVFKPIQVPYVIALYAVSGVCGPILGPVCQFLASLISNSANLNILDPRDPGGVCVSLLAGESCADDPYRERWDTWTATLWLLAGITALTTVFIFFVLPETLYSNILYRRARRLRAQTGNPAYQSQADIDTPKINLAMRIAKQTIDDFKLSCMDPVILFVNMHTMLIYGILYLWFEFFPYGEYILAA